MYIFYENEKHYTWPGIREAATNGRRHNVININVFIVCELTYLASAAPYSARGDGIDEERDRTFARTGRPMHGPLPSPSSLAAERPAGRMTLAVLQFSVSIISVKLTRRDISSKVKTT